jgi:hypothetical protein
MRLRLRGPQTVKTEVSRTFHNCYSSDPNPPDPREKWSREDAKLKTWNKDTVTYDEAVERLTVSAVDELGIPDQAAHYLITELCDLVIVRKQRVSTAFRKMFKGAGGRYSEDTVRIVYVAACQLANTMGTKQPREMDYRMAMYGEAIPVDEPVTTIYHRGSYIHPDELEEAMPATTPPCEELARAIDEINNAFDLPEIRSPRPDYLVPSRARPRQRNAR